jgi:hypothetical protein
MRTLLFIALLFASTTAMAESPPAADGPEGRPHQEMSFEDMKAHILKRMGERRACVEAAQDKEALRACMPHKGKGKGWHRKGEGQEQGEGKGAGEGPAGAPKPDAE